jgi:ComF family protein
LPAKILSFQLKTLLKDLTGDFVSLLYPRYCSACEGALVKGEEIICTRCLLELPKSNYHKDNENPFYFKLNARMPIKGVLALYKFSKISRVQHLLHALKYKSHPEIGITLGKIYGDELRRIDFQNQIDLIIPVPLHRQRKRARGYNQSEQFGKGLSELLNVECSDEVIRRAVKTETQTRRTKLQRWVNVKDGFEIVLPDKVNGKRILLVDDVITTGATIEACGLELLQAGCKELYIGCIAAAQ